MGNNKIEYGEKNFLRKLKRIEEFYNTERHHQGLDGDIPNPKDDAYNEKGRVTRLSRCGGAQSYYYRKSA